MGIQPSSFHLSVCLPCHGFEAGLPWKVLQHWSLFPTVLSTHVEMSVVARDIMDLCSLYSYVCHFMHIPQPQGHRVPAAQIEEQRATL